MDVKRLKMRTCVFLFCFLGLGFKGSALGNFTKVYYLVLQTDESAIKLIEEKLNKFSMSSSDSFVVKDPAITTICSDVNNQTVCQCRGNYKWSDKLCDSQPTSFNEIPTCTFQRSQTPVPMCVPTARVVVTGSVKTDTPYHEDLSNPQSNMYDIRKNEVLKTMLNVYSTFPKFDSLTILGFRRGSTIVDFQIVVNTNISSGQLTEKTAELQTLMNGLAQLQTLGLVQITAPTKTVPYQSPQQLKCSAKQDLILHSWQLQRNLNYQSVNDVTTGTESTIENSHQNSTLGISAVSEVWAGLFSCVYNTNSSGIVINHKASATLDVALLPDISITSDPQFPMCSKSIKSVDITFQCEINNSTENYTVTWVFSPSNDFTHPLETKTSSYGTIIYSAISKVNCSQQNIPQNMTCTFLNRLNQQKSATVQIPIICDYCTSCTIDNDWPIAKPNYSAVLKCAGVSVGKRKRFCSDGSPPFWAEEVSSCVNMDLNNILSDAENLVKGLGTVEKNIPGIFSRFKHSTSDSQAINTFANINASVNILSTVDDVSKSLPGSALGDFIESSSNLLSSSLGGVWNSSTSTDKSNKTLITRYLQSVEGLVRVAEMKENRTTKPNIELVYCEQDCEKVTVFNVNISVRSGGQPTKTMGFKFLDGYLQPKNDRIVNSIVVSATVPKNSTETEITISFPFTKPRPQNVMMECVFWDTSEETWSGAGCTWVGARQEGLCVCKHLTSFTILMSKKSVEMPYMDELTYVGLGVSIISLLVCLAIESLVWTSLVKSDISFFRHTTHINICLCSIVAHSTFFASAFPDKISSSWCQNCVVLKHFSYLAMFFWMLCLSIILLHQITFTFHNLSKKVFLGSSFFLGYFCPIVIVVFTIISYDNKLAGSYYDSKTCWLLYEGLFKGSIHTFVLPVGIIVIINMFCMLVVVMKLLNPKMAEHNNLDEKKAAKGILKAIIVLTPILGTTWFLGFFVLTFDLTEGVIAYFINYAFTLLNGFQGFFILLATYLGDKSVREALLKRIVSQSTQSGSSTKMSSMKSY